MPSGKSRMVIFMMRHSHLLRGQLKRRAMIDENTSIAAFRQEAERGAKMFGKLPEGMTVSPVTVSLATVGESAHADMHAEWYLPAGVSKDRVILYFHGGGYVSGSCKTHWVHVAKFAQRSGTAALLFDYRVAPEHPYPAAIEDAVAAYCWLLEQGVSPDHIVFMGDSAGGGLCLAAMLALRDQGIDLPAGAVAMSPWTDLKCTGDSLRTKAKVDPFTPGDAWTIFSRYYVGDNDPGLPWISPLYGDLRGLPPILIVAGDYDVLFDDSARFAQKAKEAGVEVRFEVGEGLFHCYPVCGDLFPEAREAMADICAFIKARVE